MGLSRGRSSSSSTLRERVADAIRLSIIKNEIQPGERISEPEMARRFQISRTPVREALRQLGSEGFLEVIPRRGARVGTFSTQDIQEFYEVKSLLEGYAARLATPCISDREIDRLEHLNDQMERYHQSGELQKIPRLHQAFHDLIVEASRNDQLVTLIRALVNRFQRFTIQLALSGRNGEAFVQHRQIIDAFRRRNAEEAEHLVKANAMLGRELMIREASRHEEKGEVN